MKFDRFVFKVIALLDIANVICLIESEKLSKESYLINIIFVFFDAIKISDIFDLMISNCETKFLNT